MIGYDEVYFIKCYSLGISIWFMILKSKCNKQRDSNYDQQPTCTEHQRKWLPWQQSGSGRLTDYWDWEASGVSGLVTGHRETRWPVNREMNTKRRNTIGGAVAKHIFCVGMPRFLLILDWLLYQTRRIRT